MSTLPLQKINIVGHLSRKEEILNFLQKNEVVEIRPPKILPPKEKASFDFDLDLTEIESSINFLEKAIGKRKSFLETFIPFKEEVKEWLLYATFEKFPYKEIVSQIKSLESKLAQFSVSQQPLISEYQTLLPWEILKLKLVDLGGTEKTGVVLGILKTKFFGEFKKKLEKLSDYFYLEQIKRDKTQVYLILYYLRLEEKVLLDFLSKSEFINISLPQRPRTAKEEMRYLLTQLDKIREERKQLIAEVQKLYLQRSKLTYVYDYLLLEKTKFAVEEKILNTDYAFILEGWIKEKDFSRLENELKKKIFEVEIFKVSLSPGEQPPTVIENREIFSPFELITKIYGLPKYGFLDPTTILSFFFVLFFGLCLGDTGYGVILSFLALFFLKRYKLPQGGINLMKLLLLGGIVTFWAGILTGSYFGVSPKDLPSPFADYLSPLQIIDPIRDPLKMLFLSLALGVTQILFGISLSFFEKIKNKDYLNAFLDRGSWLFFLSSLVIFVVIRHRTAMYLAISGAIILTLTQGRHEKNIFKKIVTGVLSLYQTTGYLGDTLSYSRLLALSMSSAIIGMVVNILASLTKNSIPVLGYVIMLAILIFGHTFNLIVSTLSAFIHSLRLQLVEFFSKFFEGGGVEFKPFRRETKYVMIK